MNRTSSAALQMISWITSGSVRNQLPFALVVVGKYLWTGHYTGYLSQVRESHPNAIAFVNPPIFKEPANLPEELKRGRVALSSHYYDGLTMLGKRESCRCSFE